MTHSRRTLCSLAGVLAIGWPLLASGQSDSFPAGGGDLIITPVVHASVQVEYDGLVIQVDPWGAAGLARYRRPADLILVTDTPAHHLDAEAIATLSSPETLVIVTANGSDRLPGALVMANGDRLRSKGIIIEAVAAYDILPGAPEHPKGDANGYVLTLGGKRLFFAGVSECVEEIRVLDELDIVFLPLNIPPGRMTPGAAAECARALAPEAVYTYHYDQGYGRRLQDPSYTGPVLPGGLSVTDSLDQFAQALTGSGIDYRLHDWYPAP